MAAVLPLSPAPPPAPDGVRGPGGAVLDIDASEDKYRGLVIAAAAFLLISLGVLTLSLFFAKGSAHYDALRWVQVGGVLLALANFAVILFVLIRSLRVADRAIDAAINENRAILKGVREGLFLITPGYRIGSQFSQSTHALFGRMLHPGDSFLALLQPLVSEKMLSDTRAYVDLLFATHVKEALVQGMNPLSQLEVTDRHSRDGDARRHLSFSFDRVHENGAVRHLLITVTDITEQLRLDAKLQSERQNSRKEFAMLLKAIDADPALLRQFVMRAETSLLAINDIMGSLGGNERNGVVLRRIYDLSRRVQSLKEEAAAVNLDAIASQAQAIEHELQSLRLSDAPEGRLAPALLSAPLPLEDLLNKIAALKSLAVLQRPVADADTSAPEAIDDVLTALAKQLAQDAGKLVEPHVQMSGIAQLDETSGSLLREIAVQMVRNTIDHGIETPDQRVASGKSSKGKVEVQLARSETEWTLTVRDDGAGLSAALVRERLVELGWYSLDQLDSFNERQIVSHIFKPGFSTSSGRAAHAGQGIGLDLVQTNVQKLGARMLLSTKPGQFTEFKVKFA